MQVEFFLKKIGLVNKAKVIVYHLIVIHIIFCRPKGKVNQKLIKQSVSRIHLSET